MNQQASSSGVGRVRVPLETHELHVVVLGAGGVGKTCLASQFVHDEWLTSYNPTVEDAYRTHIHIDGRPVLLEILDTAGTEHFVTMRDLYIKAGQGFILVFSVTSASSFKEITEMRDEIIHVKDDWYVPIVIVGNKIDLKDQRVVPKALAVSLSNSWKTPYYEASARNKFNVNEPFVDICRQMIRRESQHNTIPPELDDAGKSDLASRIRARFHRKKHTDSSGRCVIL